MSGWYGVDLDGTLAVWSPEIWTSDLIIGDPIPEMVQRVRNWLMEGKDVRIFTARVSHGGKNPDGSFLDISLVVQAIQDWSELHIGVRLPVTNVKDHGLIELWDDRAVRVRFNEGFSCCSHHVR